MAIKLPEKAYFTFHELMNRWQCTENDLSRLVISGQLKPSILFGKGTLHSVRWEQYILDGSMWATQEIDTKNALDSYAPCPPKACWLYLQKPVQQGPLDCDFQLATDVREPQIPSYELDPYCRNWFEIGYFMDMQEIKARGFFMLEEVAKFESENDEKTALITAKSIVCTKERNTLLTIIAVLCNEAKFDYTKAAKTAGFISSTAAKMGVPIGETTIEGHLKKIPDALGSRAR